MFGLVLHCAVLILCTQGLAQVALYLVLTSVPTSFGGKKVTLWAKAIDFHNVTIHVTSTYEYMAVAQPTKVLIQSYLALTYAASQLRVPHGIDDPHSAYCICICLKWFVAKCGCPLIASLCLLYVSAMKGRYYHRTNLQSDCSLTISCSGSLQLRPSNATRPYFPEQSHNGNRDWVWAYSTSSFAAK